MKKIISLSLLTVAALTQTTFAAEFPILSSDLPPTSRTKVMAVSPQILENCGYEDHTIYR